MESLQVVKDIRCDLFHQNFHDIVEKALNGKITEKSVRRKALKHIRGLQKVLHESERELKE